MQKQYITWERFEQCNQGQNTSVFENMCRMLFNYQFFNNEAHFHSNPQNPGVEIEPIYEPISKKNISFQAKYFDNRINYSKIKCSVETTIRNYSGKIDVIYLYCNKDIDTSTKMYCDAVDLLKKNDINIIPITNMEILNSIITKDCSVIAAYYFDNKTIRKEWFDSQLATSLTNLEPRFNRDFNVKVKIENQLDLFCRTTESIACVNTRKRGCGAACPAKLD